MEGLNSDNAAVIEPSDLPYFDPTEPDGLYDSAAPAADGVDRQAEAAEISWRVGEAVRMLREARRMSTRQKLNGTLEEYERHLSRIAAHFGKLSCEPGACVLCSGGDIYKGGGIF